MLTDDSHITSLLTHGFFCRMTKKEREEEEERNAKEFDEQRRREADLKLKKELIDAQVDNRRDRMLLFAILNG